MKIIDLDEIYKFLVEFFHLKSLRCSKKKLMTYLDIRVFSTFHTCSLTAFEPKLTAVAWRAQKVGAVPLKTAELFQGTQGIMIFFNGT